MITRRDAVRLLGSASAAAWLAAAQFGLNNSIAPNDFAAKHDSTPPLALGAPSSPERLALIEAFKKRSEGLQDKFEARTHKSDWEMPYRLFRPALSRKAPLVLYLHGSGGLGDDNLKQLAFGNIFGTRLWLLPENQKRFPCYVLAPQTDRGWIRYDFSQQPALELPGFGDGTRLALEIVDKLRPEFAIDERRIYVAGNSMGGAGVWNMLANRPNFLPPPLLAVQAFPPMTAPGRLPRRCGISTGMLTRSFLCPHRVSVWRRDEKREHIRFIPSTPAWITMAQRDWLSPNQRCQSGCSLRGGASAASFRI